MVNKKEVIQRLITLEKENNELKIHLSSLEKILDSQSDALKVNIFKLKQSILQGD